ncbi:MAG: hypothetical protein J3Q66DRAFT_293469 [Benniella sp.]|nr:MAG: hypothetical protein J3Q66DRAFT_293469 [Benniella sp.]
MRLSQQLGSISILGAILASLVTLHTSTYQASAAPLPRPTHDAYEYFPYSVSGPVPPSLYHAGQVLNSCIQPKSYAVSFDDGPGQLTDELLDHLDEQNLKVTFFMNGDNWHCIYSPESQRLLKRAFESQHQIAAHPWSHRDLEDLSDDEIREEMRKIEDAFRKILGVVPRYMRPPYGEHSKRVQKIMEEMGYIMILWDVDQPEIHAHESTSSQNSDFDMNSVSETGDHGDDQDDASEKQPFHNHRTQSPFTSKWAEAVRGVPHLSLDRDTMMVGGIFQEATSVWAVEYVLYHGYDVMPVGACLGETDPRLWYKEIGAPADPSTLPQSCNL